MKTSSDRSSLGWSPADRAPRLRRAANLLELRAKDAEQPDKVRRLARDMRIRAAEIEAASYECELFEERLTGTRVTAGFMLLA